jgi:hypothetical protein
MYKLVLKYFYFCVVISKKRKKNLTSHFNISDLISIGYEEFGVTRVGSVTRCGATVNIGVHVS